MSEKNIEKYHGDSLLKRDVQILEALEEVIWIPALKNF